MPNSARVLTNDEALDEDVAKMIFGFIPAMLWLLWLVVRGAWNDWKESHA